ncbi:hypothetical protein ACFFGH_20985 [Lysobacter korlensis]|uniref:Antibiotic biosynthesis monooxygenase n=1 Tax=Lysobacter korlensis TaxID=553636 RepID=A0ABV6RWN8_9GAMM
MDHRDEEFLRLWERASELLQAAAGDEATRLHRALQPDAKYRFINVAEIGSVEDWCTAITSPEFVELSRTMSEFQPAPSLYTVARENDLSSAAPLIRARDTVGP